MQEGLEAEREALAASAEGRGWRMIDGGETPRIGDITSPTLPPAAATPGTADLHIYTDYIDAYRVQSLFMYGVPTVLLGSR